MSLVKLILKSFKSILNKNSEVDLDKDPLLSEFPSEIREFFYPFEKDYSKKQLYAMMDLALGGGLNYKNDSLPIDFYGLNIDSAKERFDLSDEDIEYAMKVKSLVSEEIDVYKLINTLKRDRIISHSDRIIHHYSQGRLSDRDLVFLMEKELMNLAKDQFSTLAYSYAPDHVVFPQYLGYGILNNIFSKQQLGEIKKKFDHGDTLKSFPKSYGGDKVSIQSELAKVFELKKRIPTKKEDDFYDPHPVCSCGH